MSDYACPRCGAPVGRHYPPCPSTRRRRVIGVLLFLLGCSCTPPSVQPPYDGPAPIVGKIPAATVYSELVSAKCFPPDDSGATLLAVVDLYDSHEAGWMDCLFDGGSVAACKPSCVGGD
jgi:hypothetical protein